jgi:hypothetical protein
MLQVFQRYIASVSEICCKHLFGMFYLFQMYLANVLSECGYTHMLQTSMKMFHLFQTYANVLSRCCICCSDNTHMLQAYVANVLPISDICCRSASCCNISKCTKLHMRRRSPRVRGSERAWVVSTCMRSSMGTQHHAYA